ncbi:MAG: hypothetical protein AB8B96_14560 [Lysobacterales bacterium]
MTFRQLLLCLPIYLLLFTQPSLSQEVETVDVAAGTPWRDVQEIVRSKTAEGKTLILAFEPGDYEVTQFEASGNALPEAKGDLEIRRVGQGSDTTPVKFTAERAGYRFMTVEKKVKVRNITFKDFRTPAGAPGGCFRIDSGGKLSEKRNRFENCTAEEGAGSTISAENGSTYFSYESSFIVDFSSRPSNARRSEFWAFRSTVLIFSDVLMGSPPFKATRIQQLDPMKGGQGVGFSNTDYVIDAMESTVLVNGLAAECDEQCIRVESSRLIVANMSAECDDNCVRATQVIRDESSIDLSEFLAGDNAGETALLAMASETERLLDDHDFAVVRSSFRSTDTPLEMVNNLNDDSARFRLAHAVLYSSSSGSRAMLIQNPGTDNLITDSVLAAPNSRVDAMDLVYGEFDVRNLMIDAGEEGLKITDGKVTVGASALSLRTTDDKRLKAVCDTTFSADEINSAGYNIVADDSCIFAGPGDLTNTAPGFTVSENGSVDLLSNSPLIDGGPFVIDGNELPCGTTDILGVPRPQDANNDGIAECDVGPIEVVSAAAIGAAQSGAYFDSSRNGEGVFLEMLGNGQALMYLFSYLPNGSGQFWALGVGRVVGNGVVINKADFLTTSGATFGENFNPSDVQRTPFADVSISFPTCSNADRLGTLAIEPNSDLGYPPLLSRTSRLTSVMNCDSLQANGPGYTGSFFDPSHNGEGVIVQVLSETDALMIWFTYDAQGNQYWIIGSASINGNVITAVDALTQSGPRYGPQFNANDISSTVWGDFSLTFGEDCNSAQLSYDSVVAGFGVGEQSMVRIAGVQGISCDG